MAATREVVRALGVIDRAVREEGDQESLLLRVGVDVEEVATREDLAAGEQQPETPRVGEFVEDTAVLVVGELAGGRVSAIGRLL